MRKVVTAKTAGFCFGVQRAVDTVYKEVEKGGPIYTYGPIIHNEEVVADLAQKGVQVLEEQDLDRLEELPKGSTVVIRSHGVSREVDEKLRSAGCSCVDATCPFVKRIHKIVSEESAKGAQIVIIGNPVHPEVRGIMGWACGEVCVIENQEQAEAFSAPDGARICVVAQTTFNANKFKDLVAILNKRRYNMLCMDTICSATHERQTEAREIAARADVMIVIGGRSSSNSAKLFEICKKECPETYFIQTWRDLHLSPAESEQMIGITAGASTPKNIIEEVQNHVRTDF